MALPAIADPEAKKFTLVSQYTISRLGLLPTVTIQQRDCVYMVDTAVTVESASDLDGDGKVEVLVLPELGGRTDLAGRLLVWPDNTDLGTIASVQQVTAPDGTTKAQVTLTQGLSISPVGQSANLVALSVFGSPAYQALPTGRAWENTLMGEEAMAYLGDRLAAAYVAATKAILPQLGITTVTDNEITMAVQALAARNTNIESFIAEQAEQVELDRRTGAIPWLRVTGRPPATM